MSYTHKEIADLLGIAEPTIKRYRRCFPQYLVPENRGKPFRYPEHALDVCRRIRDAFAAGEDERAIERSLAKEYPHLAALPRSVWSLVKPSAKEASDPPLHATMVTMLDALLTAQQETNHRLAVIQTMLETPKLPQDKAMDAIETRLQAIEAAILRLRKVFAHPHAAPGSRSMTQTAPGAPSPLPPEAETLDDNGLPPDMRALPITVQLEDGDYISVAGRSHGPITLEDLAAALDSRSVDMGQWAPYKEGWEMAAPGNVSNGSPELKLYVTRRETPRGNTVCALLELVVDGVPMPPASFYTVYRQLLKK